MAYEHEANDKRLMQLGQRIHLLYLLNNIPEAPFDNWVENRRINFQEEHGLRQRSLTLTEERRLAETFAFFAAATDDPRKVVAACAEEDESGTSVVIRLAVNHGGFDTIRDGLDKLATIVEEVHRKSQSP